MLFSLSYDDSVYNILPVIIWLGNFFKKAYDVELSVYLEMWREKGCVSWQKNQLADVRNQHVEITGVKQRPIINLTFYNSFVMHLVHQNSGLYSCTKWNSFKSIICGFKSKVTTWETVVVIW